MNLAIRMSDLQRIGSGLIRPECVVASGDGQVFCSDARGGIMCIKGDCSQKLLGRKDGLVPNGIALLPEGSFLLANVGSDGGVWHLNRNEEFTKVEICLEGNPLPEVNFVYVDDKGRIWISVSSGGAPDPVFTKNANEGFIVLGDEKGFRVVASGLGWTNELRVNSKGDKLFVNETFGRRLLQFDIDDEGTLSNRTVLVAFGIGDYPDGMALDAEGGIWVVSIISNRVYRVKEGECVLLFEDKQQEIIDHIERLLDGPGLRRSDLHGIKTGSIVNNLSSIAFGGEDMKTAFLGSLNDDCIWSFRSPIAGMKRVPSRSPVIHLPGSV